MPAPPRRPDESGDERSPFGIALRAVLGACLGVTVAIVVAGSVGMMLIVGRVPELALALAPPVGVWACAAFGWRERRSGDPAMAAGLLGISVALALAVVAWWVLAALETR